MLGLKIDAGKIAFKMEEKVMGDLALGVLLVKGSAQAAECPARSIIDSRAFS